MVRNSSTMNHLMAQPMSQSFEIREDLTMERAKWKKSFLLLALAIPLLFVLSFPQTSSAQLPFHVNGNFFFQAGGQFLFNDRANEPFTDFMSGSTGTEPADQQMGWYVGMGLDMPLWELPWGDVIVGTINIDVRRIETPDKTFITAQGTPSITAPGQGQDLKQQGGLTTMGIMVHPKYRIGALTTEINGKLIQPWIIPFGFEMQAFAPPSPGLNIFEVGSVFGVGVDMVLTKRLVIGLDNRWHVGSGQTGIGTLNTTFGGYVGIRF
jgi:hypothetical protein